MLAGYFLGRNITWNKAFNRALWLFIPFMFWNVLYVLLVLPHDGASFRLENLIGIRDVFLPGINLFPADDSHAVPPIGPSWFLRDIIILTLLTPLLVRVKILLFPAVLLFFCFFNVAPDHMETISIGTCAFYLLGVALSSRKIDDIHLVLNKKFGIFFWVSIFMPVVLIALYSAGMIPLWKETAIGMLLGVMMIMYAGICIIYLILQGVGDGSQPLISQCYGKKNWDDLKFVRKLAYGFAFALSVIGCIIMYVTRGSLGMLFGASGEVNAEIARIMPVFLLSVPFVAILRITTASFYATEKSTFSYILTFIEPIFMLVLMLILPPLFGGQIMIWWSTVLARILSALLALVLKQRVDKKETC